MGNDMKAKKLNKKEFIQIVEATKTPNKRQAWVDLAMTLKGGLRPKMDNVRAWHAQSNNSVFSLSNSMRLNRGH